MTLADLPTPALLVDLDVLERNLDAMQAKCDRLGVALRPHVKTHKCVEVGRMQLQRGARGITVSTLEEARAFADAGFDDVTWAFPVIPGRIDEARELGERTRLGLLVDHRGGVEALRRSGADFDVWLKIDCGYHRAGVDPDGEEAVRLARSIADTPTLRFRGILTHSGQAYHVTGEEALAAIAETERAVIVRVAARLRNEGIPVPGVSVGSTPAMSAVRDLTGVTEARPGNYAYFDLMQVTIGSCEPDDCALSVLATVVSSASDHAVVDAGALALSKDPGLDGPGGSSMGRVRATLSGGPLPGDVRLVELSQEHGKTSGPLPHGERVRIAPNHSCLTAACFDRLHAVRGEDVVDAWRVRRER